MLQSITVLEERLPMVRSAENKKMLLPQDVSKQQILRDCHDRSDPLSQPKTLRSVKAQTPSLPISAFKTLLTDGRVTLIDTPIPHVDQQQYSRFEKRLHEELEQKFQVGKFHVRFGMVIDEKYQTCAPCVLVIYYYQNLNKTQTELKRRSLQWKLGRLSSVRDNSIYSCRILMEEIQWLGNTSTQDLDGKIVYIEEREEMLQSKWMSRRVKRPEDDEWLCTLGGIIDVGTETFGLTVAHAFYPRSIISDCASSYGSITEKSSDCSDSLDRNIQETFVGDNSDDEPLFTAEQIRFRIDQTSESITEEDPNTMLATIDLQEIYESLRTARLRFTSQNFEHDDDQSSTADWALICPQDEGFSSPNIHDWHNSSDEEVLELAENVETGSRVIIRANSAIAEQSGVIDGPTSIVLGGSQLHTLRILLDSSSDLLRGASGSWVIQNRSLVGYLIAGTRFTAYIIPILTAFRSISDCLGGASVGLAEPGRSRSTILSWGIPPKLIQNLNGPATTEMLTRAAANGQITFFESILAQLHSQNEILVGERTRRNKGFEDSLCWAALGGHLEIVKLLLQRWRNDNNMDDPHSNTSRISDAFQSMMIRSPLTFGASAMLTGAIDPLMLDVFRRETQIPKSRNSLDKWPSTVRSHAMSKALCRASSTGHVDTAQVLLAHGTDPNEVDGHPIKTPLQYAASNGHWNMVKMLLGHEDTAVYINNSDCAVLQAAAEAGQTGIVDLLLNHKNKQCNPAENLETVLCRAAGKGYTEAVEALLKYGVDTNCIDSKNNTPLQRASKGGHVEAVKALLRHNADVNAAGGNSGSALQLATTRGWDDIVEMLLEHNANVNADGGGSGSALCIAVINNRTAIVKMLLEHEADVNATGGDFGSALQIAVMRGWHHMVMLLIQHKANVNAIVGRHGTALYVAVEAGRIETVKLLLENSADLNLQAKEETVLQVAASSGRLDIVHLLVREGVERIINIQNSDGDTALHLAARESHIDIVQVLLDEEADFYVRNHRGYTAAEVARMTQDNKVVGLLKSYTIQPTDKRKLLTHRQLPSSRIPR